MTARRDTTIIRLELLFIVLISIALSYCTECPAFSKTCTECIAIPGCAWCTNQTYQEARCNTEDQLTANGCDEIENPETRVEKIRDEEVADAVYINDQAKEPISPAIQIQPQQIHLRIRQDETKRIQVKVRQAQDYPVDVYYLMDLSYSMDDDLKTIKNVAGDIASNMRRLTRSARLGFGSFVDKPITPFIDITPSKIEMPCRECEKAYSFRNVLNLTDELDLFEQKVSNVNISRNLDSPEGTFDAMMQAAVCTEQIGWRSSARHLLLLTADGVCHIQGDGRIGRVLTPNDGRCYMSNNEYTASHLYDYPSVAHLNQKLVENNILPIFAVTSGQQTAYRKIKELMEGAHIAPLASDSRNIVNLIETIYEEITTGVKLTHTAPENIDVAISSDCGSGIPGENGASCLSVALGIEITFDVDVTASGCVQGANNYSFQIYPVGLDERLNVTVDVLCDCSCQENREPDSSYCNNGNGSLVCGTCDCYPGYYGEFCDCRGDLSDEVTDLATCKPNNQTDVLCSGRGECICGECECDTSEDMSVSGLFCECSDKQCPIYDDKICGGPGRGSCTCKDGRINECKCLPGFSGPACECITSIDPCVAPETGLVCNAEGTCECGKCECSSSKFYGEHCGQCVTCKACHIHVNCVKCKVFKEGITQTECNMCTQNIQNVTESTPNFNSSSFETCSYINDDSCTVTYHVRQSDNAVDIYVEPELDCPAKPVPPFPLIPVIIGIALGIVLLGLLLILIFRTYTWYLDKKEFEQLLKEQANADFQKGVNPLYQQSTQTFKNPMYGKAIVKT